MIDLLGVTSYSDSGEITTSNGGVIEFNSGLTSLNGVTLTIQSTAGAGLLDQLTSFKNGVLTVEGGAQVADLAHEAGVLELLGAHPGAAQGAQGLRVGLAGAHRGVGAGGAQPLAPSIQRLPGGLG